MSCLVKYFLSELPIAGYISLPEHMRDEVTMWPPLCLERQLVTTYLVMVGECS